MFSLEKKVALITGGNKGLGKYIAIAIARAGADITVVSRTPALDVENEVRKLGKDFLHINADLNQIGSIGHIISSTLEKYHKIDILINNSGIARRMDAIDFTVEDWDDVMSVNCKSLFFLSQAFAKQLLKQGTGGKIINTASMLSFQGGIRAVSYTASKFGVRGITMLMANEWARHGINVNAVAPGYMETSLTAELRNDTKRYNEILLRIPAGRWGTPNDVEGAYVFLASSASDYINGITLPVDGGWLAR